MCKVVERPGEGPLVTQLSRQHEALFVERRRALMVALTQCHPSQVAESQRDVPLVIQFSEPGKALFEQCRRPLRVALKHQSHRLGLRQSLKGRQWQTGRQLKRRHGVIVLAVEA
jgi:hypothetical protein